MKKFLTFLALALLTVTGAWAGNITDVKDAKAGGYYTIVCPRNALTVSSDMTTLASASVAGRTFNAYDPYFLFQFVKSGDNYVLYNVGAAKYFTNEGNTVDNISDANAITLYDWDNGTAQLRWDNDHALNIGGQMEIGINTWKNKDVGNQYTVAEVEPCEVVVKGNVPATTTVSVKGTSYANGATIPVTTSFSVSDVVAPSVEGYTPVVAITGNELVVNYQPNIDLTDLAVKSVGALTTTVTEGQWYVMTQTRDGETPVYDQGANQRLRTEESSKVAGIFTVLRPANAVSNYLIRFINTGAQSYAIQFANGNYWYVTATPAARNVGIIPDATNFQKFIFNEATNTGDGNKTGLAFNATEDGVTFGANLDHNNISGGATLNFWGDGKQTSGANNVWYIYPVEIGTVSITTDVTYNYYFKNTLIDTKTSAQEIGATVAAPPTIDATQHAFVKVEYDATAVVATGLTVRVDVIETTPFIAAESVDKIEHWYALNIHSNQTHYLYSNNGAIAHNDTKYEADDTYAWGFVGNIFDGYTIYNKDKGNGVALDSATPCALTAAGLTAKWIVSASKETSDKGKNGFCINVSGQQYVNYQNGELKRWGSNDAGSTFTPYEIDFSTKTYTVHITGAPTGTEVTYKGNKYADGGTFSAESVSSTEITPDEVVGYIVNVDVNGTDINVEYSLPPLTGMSDIVEKRIYTLESVDRGYFVYSSTNAANYISGSMKASYTFDATDKNFHFVFLQNNGKTYLYSLGAEKFVAYASDGLVTSAIAPSEGIDLLASTGGAKTTHPTVLRIDDSHQCNMSNNQGYGILTSWNSTGDNGNMLRILPVGELTDTELAAIKEVFIQKKDYTVTITGAPSGTKVSYNEEKYGDGEVISAVSVTKEEITPDNVEGYKAEVTVNGTSINVAYYERIKTNQLYVLSTKNRGAWVVDGEDFKSTSSTGVGKSIDSTDKYQLFAIYEYNDAYYLWSEGAQHFISNAGKVASIQEASPVEWSEEAGGTYFFHFTDAADKYININGSKAMDICYWSSADEGNMMHLTPVEGFDANVVAAVIANDLTPAPIEITIGETGYATIAYTEDFVKPEGLKVYYCIDGGEEGHLTPVEWEKSYLPYYCAYILEGTPGTYSFEVTNDYEEEGYPAEDYEALEGLFYENLLHGNFDDTDITVDDAKTECGCDNIYVFSKKNDKVGFYTYVGTTLAAHKAYYAVNTALVSGFIVDFEGTEGINAVMSATNLKAGYDIQGRRINKVQKGINILGGKKIIK